MSKETPETKAPQEQSVKDIKAALRAKKDGELVELPSGLVFRLAKPSISRLLKDNVFPQSLVATAIKMDSNTNQPVSREEYLQSLEVIDTIVHRAAVSPKVVLSEKDVDDDSVLVEDLDDQDKVAIYLYVQTGVKPLESFRSQ